MVSRLVLVCQYLSILRCVRRYKQSSGPLALAAAIYLVSALIYLGLYFNFTSSHADNIIGWYVAMVFETFAMIIISARWSELKIDETQLASRLGLLTLYILGEGVIGILKAIKAVGGTTGGYSLGSIGQIISAVLILVRHIREECLRHPAEPPRV